MRSAFPTTKARPVSLAPEQLERLQNITAEQALLGAVLIDNRILDEVLDIVGVDDFADPFHRTLFTEILSLVGAGKSASPVSLRNRLAEASSFDYVVELTSNAAAICVATELADQVAELARKRRLALDLQASLDALTEQPLPTVAADIEGAIWKATEHRTQMREISGGQMISLVLDRAREIKETGKNPGAFCKNIIDLNRLTGGLQPTHVVMVGGRPGMGKTALATSASWGYAACGYGVGFISLEMGDIDIGMRLAADVSFHQGQGINHDAIRQGNLTWDQIEAIERAQAYLSGLPLLFVDVPSLTMSQLAATARRMRRRLEGMGKKLDVLFVDYLQLLKGDGKFENRVQEVDAISRGCKQIAKENHCCVVALAQVNRGVEGREDKRPTMADLRESGGIEANADVVLFLYREEYYAKLREPKKSDVHAHERWLELLQACAGKVEIYAGKQRHAETQRAFSFFFGEFQAVRGSNYHSESYGS